MKAFLAVCVLLSSTAVAQETTTKVTFSASQTTITIAVFEGKHYLVRVASGQAPTFEPVTVTYLQLGQDGPVIPPPPPPPPPESPIEKHKAIVTTATAAVVDANKANTAAALAKLYRTIAGLPVTDRGQFAQSTNILFNALSLPETWHNWKVRVDISLANFSTVVEARAAWIATAEVLEGGAK